MPGKKKKFIDKKHAVTFHLVHRSQQDPLQADEDAPQRVLLPHHAAKEETAETRRSQQRKFGVFFDDDYNYLQHLRDVNEIKKVDAVQSFHLSQSESPARFEKKEESLKLPSSLFGSTIETGVGMLNKAAPVSGPRLDWDPDIVAGLDEDFDFNDPENQLDDDFMITANQEGDSNDDDDDDYESCSDEEEDDANVFKPYKLRPKVREADDVASDEAEYSDDGSDLDSLGEMSFGDMETKSRFTNYSMTSSVMRRNEGLTLLDDRFEKLYEQYNDEEIGALDQDDITGYMRPDCQLLNNAMEEFEQSQLKLKLEDPVNNGVEMEVEDEDSDVDKELEKMVIEVPKEKWDCESILSTYSNLYNHPQTIAEPRKTNAIKLTKRAQIPVDVFQTRGLTRKQLEEEQKRDHAGSSVVRPKNETPEERRDRKKMVKEDRKMRREEKKTNKLAFKAEKIRQEKEHINIKQNIQGLTLT